MKSNEKINYSTKPIIKITIDNQNDLGFAPWGDGLAEWTPIRSLYTHRPGIETSLASLDYNTNLFHDVFDLEKAQNQHDEFTSTLASENIKVISSYDLTKYINSEDLAPFITFDESFTKDQKSKLIDSYISHNKQLDLLLTKPSIKRISANNQDIINQFSINNPLGNFLYARDPIFQTGEKRFHLSNLKFNVRKQEANIMELLFNKLNLHSNISISIDKFNQQVDTIEGGEVVPAGDTIIIGVESHRTNLNSVYELMKTNSIGHSNVVLVISPVKTQEEMHIDTWFNIIDEDLYIGSQRFFDNPIDILYYERNENGYYLLNKEISDFKTLLENKLKMKKISINDKQQKDLMSNGLTISPKKYIMIGGKPTSQGFKKSLEKHGVEVISVELDELTEGHGGAHCMTQPIQRALDRNYI